MLEFNSKLNKIIKKSQHRLILLLGLVLALGSCKEAKSSLDTPKASSNDIVMSTETIVIDGKANESTWSKCNWQELDELWLGESLTADDFQGRYKVSWDKNKLYVLAEIHDDLLVDTHTDGLDRYWDDDCLEIFIDENRSKGNHQYNHSAFAYHISLDGKVTDIGTDSLPGYYNHVTSKRVTNGKVTTWEVAIDIYDDTYQDGVPSSPVQLKAGKVMGFALAYCDNDTSVEREHFIGSAKVEGEDKNRGWIDAGIFEAITLK